MCLHCAHSRKSCSSVILSKGPALASLYLIHLLVYFIACGYFPVPEPPVPQDGINTYLLEKVLMPALDSKDIYLKDIDFTAFDVDDIDKLEDYYDQLYSTGRGLDQFIQTVAQTLPSASSVRSFC